jgi:acetylornithine deacetylase/succinyl-diaminopimelate desuccinylase-like protein
MPTNPVRTVIDALSRDSRIRGPGSEAISFLMDLLYFGDFAILEQVSSGDLFERVNLIGRKGPSEGPGLVLAANTATSVEPVPAHWASLEGDQLGARLSRDGRFIHGLGANGGKVDMVLKIIAGSRFRSEELIRPLHLLAFSGEEAHGSGARSVIEDLSAATASGSSRGVAMVHAPTNLSLWTDHPGCISLRLTLSRRIRHRRMPPHAGFFEVRVSGRSSHVLAQTKDPGSQNDALARLLEVLATLRQHGDVRVLSIDAGEAANRVPGRARLRVATSFAEPPPLTRHGPGVEIEAIADGTSLPFPIDALFSGWLGGKDAGIAAIEGRLGTARNGAGARPDRAHWTGRLVSDRDELSGYVMLWTGPGVDTPDVCERFAQAVQRALVGQEELEVAIEVVQDRPAFAGSEGADDVTDLARLALQRASLPYTLEAGPFTTDAGLFRAHGYQTLVFGPGGPIEALYRDDESVAVKSIEAAVRFYEELIRAYCVEGRG